jgi:hypothetical protein
MRLFVGAEERKTAFERNLLPDFADWLVDEIEERQPDVLIPAETKGARVLDAALTYAGERGVTPGAPVIYKPALDFIPVETLKKYKALSVEDAVHTGESLKRHSDAIKGHQIGRVSAVACMGWGSSVPQADVDCFMRVDDELYNAFLWQLAELVTAPGLPPEVDHFLFELRFPNRFERGWESLREAIAPFGQLTIDGPSHKGAEFQTLTLHQPELLSAAASDALAGPNKIRFFPDPDGERVFVVPISFLSLEVGPELKEHTKLTKPHATGILARAGLADSEVAAQLVEASCQRDPQTVFRIAAAAREIEMVEGVAGILARFMPKSTIEPDLEGFERLFGPTAGGRLCATVIRRIEEAGARETPQSNVPEPVDPPAYLDRAVADKTKELAKELKEFHDQAEDPGERRGWSMRTLAQKIGDTGGTTISRCVDFGLANTTIVPFTAEIPLPNGARLIERHYRVSEHNRDAERPYLTLDKIRLEKAEQALALICHRITINCPAYADGQVPLGLLTQIVAILRPLVLKQHGLTLEARPTDAGLELIALDSYEPIRVKDITSAYFKVEFPADRPPLVTVSPTFHAEYDAERLLLDLERITEPIEADVDELVWFINELGETERDDLFDGWAMSTDQRLGLTHVRVSLEEAVREARLPLALILRGEDHESSSGMVEEVDTHTEEARAKLKLLRGDWDIPAYDRWKRKGSRREGRMRAALNALPPVDPGAGPTTDPASFYRVPATLIDSLDRVAGLIEVLDRASARRWAGGGDEEVREAAVFVARSAAAVECGLISLADPDDAPPSVPGDADKAIHQVAEQLDDLLERLAAFFGAAAGTFCGEDGIRRPGRVIGGVREATVLSLDVAGSTVHGEVREERAHNRWLRQGLAVAAQWTRAFGGWELADRRGDELFVEYETDGDAAALAACALLVHSAALRSLESKEVGWRFHNAIDSGKVEDATGNNAMGSCLNLAAKLAKTGDAKEENEQVLVATRAAGHTATDLREAAFAVRGEERVTVVDDDGVSQVSETPWILASAKAVEAYCENLERINEDLEAEIAVQVDGAVEEAPPATEEAGDDEPGAEAV